jgi:hypothetical protein
MARFGQRSSPKARSDDWKSPVASPTTPLGRMGTASRLTDSTRVWMRVA